MNRAIYLSLYACIGIAVVACESNNAEDLFPNDCSGISDVSYRTHVQPLLETNCYGCHDTNTAATNGNGLIFDSYATASQQGLRSDNALALSLRGIQPFGVMPPSGSALPECDIRIIEDWIQAGAPDN